MTKLQWAISDLESSLMSVLKRIELSLDSVYYYVVLLVTIMVLCTIGLGTCIDIAISDAAVCISRHGNSIFCK